MMVLRWPSSARSRCWRKSSSLVRIRSRCLRRSAQTAGAAETRTVRGPVPERRGTVGVQNRGPPTATAAIWSDESCPTENNVPQTNPPILPRPGGTTATRAAPPRCPNTGQVLVQGAKGRKHGAAVFGQARVRTKGGGQGCIRRGGEGVGRDPPPPRVPIWSPSKADQTFLILNPLGTEGAEAKFWLSASNIGTGGGGGGRGVNGGGGGSRGGTPRPPPVYGRSNTSVHRGSTQLQHTSAPTTAVSGDAPECSTYAPQNDCHDAMIVLRSICSDEASRANVPRLVALRVPSC